MTMAAPMPAPMPVTGGSISASVSVPAASISAPVSLPTSNMFSGFTSTPFMPASYYNPSTFGAPTTAFSGMPLPTPMASSVSSLPLGVGGVSYGPSSFGALTSVPRATYAPTYGGSYGTYGTSYAAPTTTYGAPYTAPTTTYTTGGSTTAPA